MFGDEGSFGLFVELRNQKAEHGIANASSKSDTLKKRKRKPKMLGKCPEGPGTLLFSSQGLKTMCVCIYIYTWALVPK